MCDLTEADGIREKMYLRSYDTGLGKRTQFDLRRQWLWKDILIQYMLDYFTFLATKYVLKQLEAKKKKKKKKLKNTQKRNRTKHTQLQQPNAH